MERVYRLQVEFSEVSQLLAQAQTLELRNELTRQRLRIIAEASELIHKMDAGSRMERVPAPTASVPHTAS